MLGLQTKGIGLALIGAVAMTTTAFADGGPRRSPRAPAAAPPPATVLSWTGFYGGVNIGAGFTDSSNVAVSLSDAASRAWLGGCYATNLCHSSISPRDSTGVIGGIQVGYNLQSGSFVIGFEADFQGSTAGSHVGLDTRVPGFIQQENYNANLEWFGTVRGRLGVLASPNLLVYATAGFAYGSVAHSFGANSFTTPPVTPFDGFFGRASEIEVGWTAGGGLEYALGGGLSLGAEYLFVDLSKGESFNTSSFSGACVVAGVSRCNATIRPADLDLHVARLKLNYKF